MGMSTRSHFVRSGSSFRQPFLATRSSGFNPVRLTTLANIRDPISS
jgi:hypothetical protein